MSNRDELIQEQVNLMYARAKQLENMFGDNLDSNYLRRFADAIGKALAA